MVSLHPPWPRARSGLTQVLDRSQNYNVGRLALGGLGKAQPPDLFSLERCAALRRSPRFSIKFIGLRARLRPTRTWQSFVEPHAGAHAPPCGSPRACVQSSFAGILWRALACSFNNRLVWSNNSGVFQDSSPGGFIMVHGQRNGFGWLAPVLQHFDWTDGCIAITNAEMDEFMSLVSPGTPIDIRW